MINEINKDLLGLEMQFYGDKEKSPLLCIMFDPNSIIAAFQHTDGSVEVTIEGMTDKAFVDSINRNDDSTKKDLIYTQDMYDNGVKPEVGMKCNIDFIGGNIFTDAELTYLSKTLGCFKCKEGVERSFDVSCINFYPITPPTPLIDGKAYQFDNGDDKGLYGVYDRLHGLFHNRDSYVVRDCTNIKPLTVKGE